MSLSVLFRVHFDITMENTLEVEEIYKSYDSLCAVKGLSFKVLKGSCFGLLGPNGSGKTTTLRMLMNIILPDKGKIHLATENVGYLPEERGLYPKMRINELLHFFAELRGVDTQTAKERIEYWLEKVGLSEVLSKRVNELSKGMQQKLQIVATVIHDPEFIVLDEPFIGLDPISIGMLREIINELQQQSKTILLSTHWMEQAERLCDSICLINKGEKVLEGNLKEIKKRFRKNGLVMEIEGEKSFLKELDFVEKIESSDNEVIVELKEGGNPEDVVSIALEKGNLTGFRVLEPSLEEIFIKTVSGE